MTGIATLEPEPRDPRPASADCPECGAAGSLVEFFCEVCVAELAEAGGDG